MMHINIDKISFNIMAPGKKWGEKIAQSSLLNAENIKDKLKLAAQNIVISGEINVDKWLLNLGVIPAAQFDTLFIPRLALAFAERLACEQTSITDQQAMKMTTSNAAESSVLLDGKHLDGEGLIQLAHSCLIPLAFKTLLQESPAYQLQQLLKLLLEEIWQSPKCLPVSWYGRVTTERLSIAAMLYLLKSQRGHDWLMHQHAPTASQVAGWAKAIARGDIPPEQVVQLLTGNRASDSVLPEQRAYSPLVVMRWLLPLWRQPTVRQVIHRLKGGWGVQRLDAYLSRCLQCQNDVMQEEKGMQSVLAQVVPPQDNTVLSPDGEVQPVLAQVIPPQDNTVLSPDGEVQSVLAQVIPPQDNTVLSPDGEVQSVLAQVIPPQDNTVLSPDEGMPSDALQIMLSQDNAMLPECEGIPAASRRTMQLGKDGLRSPNEPRSSSQGINNAGLLLLWPLLPQLFSLLNLWEEEQFVSDAARWQAVYGLDRLVWGEVSPKEGQLTLNQVLCGVSCSTTVPPPTPLSLLQRQQIDDWLAAIGQQLPGWQKLSLIDIRQLFLQRAGEINTEGPVPHISVRSEPYDFLLRDWPWPMTLASFPWAEQPLTIVWPLNGFTG